MSSRRLFLGLYIRLISLLTALFGIPFLFIWALGSRYVRKKIDVGLGPEPLINNVYHKKALIKHGYSAETFAVDSYYITQEFDINFKQFLSILPAREPIQYLGNVIAHLYLACLSMLRYQCLYIYFNGGPLGMLGWQWLKNIEPFLYHIANVKIVVMPYGSDIQDMVRSQNFNFKHAMSQDYPKHLYRRELIRAQIDIWTKHADHVISGCDWVDYMYHWDTLMLSHFSIDVEKTLPQNHGSIPEKVSSKIKILHAPNHRAIKGTAHFIRAVEELVSEGLNVELILAERMPNNQVRDLISSVDIIADQLIIGWYAMFAIEGMAMGKPTLCYIREDLEDLYLTSNLLEPEELPLIKCNPLNVKQVIKDLILNRKKMMEVGSRSHAFVQKHHSLEAVGIVFDQINRLIGVNPTGITPKGTS